MKNWMKIHGYEDYYIISDKGDVYSKRYKRNLKPQLNSTGYFQIGLTNDDGRTLFCLHKLIAEHFIPNPNNLNYINHIDGNKQNNNLNNLEWCTLSENQKHAYETGLNKALKKGIQHHKNKLTENDVLEIRKLYNSGMISQSKLALQFGVNQYNISMIVRNKIWKHI